jgi:hypothetical protein
MIFGAQMGSSGKLRRGSEITTALAANATNHQVSR